jgi:pantoate--beta-alanine ligase
MKPLVVQSVAAYRAACDSLRSSGREVVLVPTLGALHHAHQALMTAARASGGAVVASIFVNPTQFGPGEDYERYPRELEADLAVCEAAGVELVFVPGRAEMYPEGEATRVVVHRLTEVLCGPFRPGHFEGVATVVAKLLAATGPCAAVFGRKDYQQKQVIQRLVQDLFLPARIIEHPTVRDADGLATSSRNRYLSASERERALALPRALSRVSRRFAAGEREVAQLEHLLVAELARADIEVQYAVLAGSRDLQPLVGRIGAAGEAGAFIAAKVGTTRLIDNTILGVDRDPLSTEVAHEKSHGG